MDSTAKRTMDTDSVKDFATHKAHDMKDSLKDVRSMVRDRSAALVEDSVDLVKRYPISTAVGAVAVGFLAGIFLGGRR